MTQEKSRIDSFDVSLGRAPVPGAPGAAQKQLEKWNILVCSDLGYVSQKPDPVRIAEWNEFMASRNIVLSGTIEQELTDAHKPMYVEIPVKSIKDLTTESIMANTAPFSAFSRTVFALEQLLDGKTTADDAMSLIKKAGLPQAEESHVLGLFAARPASPQRKPAGRPQNSSIDNILSMVDGTSSSGDGAHNATEALFASASVADSGGTPLDKKAASEYVHECRTRLRGLADNLQKQAFFSSRKTSWNCFMALAKVLGRKKEIGLSVVSAPRQDMEENLLPKILPSCMEQSAAPDIIVWDYDVSFTNASMDAMTRIAKAADQYKCMVVAPLSEEDPLFQGISERAAISHYFDEVRFLPFKKLRTDPSSRCLCLCGPRLTLADSSAPSGGRCCWFVATRWAEMLCGESNPFSAKDSRRLPAESVFSPDDIFGPDIAPGVAREAAAAGLTLFEPSLSQASLDKAVSVIGGDQAAGRYSSFLFNLTVNRVVRCAGVRLLAEGAQKGRADVASALERFLRAELHAYGAITSDGQVTAVAGDDGRIAIDVNSDVTVSGHPIRFTFSF